MNFFNFFFRRNVHSQLSTKFKSLFYKKNNSLYEKYINCKNEPIGVKVANKISSCIT